MKGLLDQQFGKALRSENRCCEYKPGSPFDASMKREPHIAKPLHSILILHGGQARAGSGRSRLSKCQIAICSRLPKLPKAEEPIGWRPRPTRTSRQVREKRLRER